jgi:hypothetical protein
MLEDLPKKEKLEMKGIKKNEQEKCLSTTRALGDQERLFPSFCNCMHEIKCFCITKRERERERERERDLRISLDSLSLWSTALFLLCDLWLLLYPILVTYL